MEARTEKCNKGNFVSLYLLFTWCIFLYLFCFHLSCVFIFPCVLWAASHEGLPFYLCFLSGVLRPLILMSLFLWRRLPFDSFCLSHLFSCSPRFSFSCFLWIIWTFSIRFKFVDFLTASLCIVVYDWSRAEFLSLSIIEIWGCLSLCCGSLPVHCGIVSRTLGLYPLDDSSTPPVLITRNTTGRCETSLGGQTRPSLGTPAGLTYAPHFVWRIYSLFVLHQVKCETCATIPVPLMPLPRTFTYSCHTCPVGKRWKPHCEQWYVFQQT